MNHFFKVKSLEEVLALKNNFSAVGSESIEVSRAFSRVLSTDLTARGDMPGFRRATMDGYAVLARSTFGASESSPAWLDIKGTVLMGDIPDFKLGPGEAARISTGGMLPKGADGVVMVEHTEAVDETSVEIYKSVAPLQHVIDASEDFAKHQQVLSRGTFVRPQEQGLAAGLGFSLLDVHKIPRVGIISTGDEVIPIDQEPEPGKIRDINSYSLAGLIREANTTPVLYGIVRDDPDELKNTIKKALNETDMVLVSGGSSVGARDYTLEVLSELPDTEILVHGMSVSPGKPTILAQSGHKPVWGLPGQVVSAMVVFKVAVVPFLDRLKGLVNRDQENKASEEKSSEKIAPENKDRGYTIQGKLSRNIASAQGRRDFVRVMLKKTGGGYLVEPVLGKSGLIKTMILADGLLEIGDDVEGLEKGSLVDVILL